MMDIEDLKEVPAPWDSVGREADMVQEAQSDR